MDLTLKEQFVEEVRSHNFDNVRILFETSNEQYIRWLEKKISQSDKIAVGFAIHCREQLHFGLYSSFENQLQFYKKENNL